jgi:hypothetical protein
MYGRLIFSFRRAAPLLTVVAVSACPLLEPPPPPARYGPVAQEGTLWCYKTLGTPECYAEEQPQFASRLIGSYVERPLPPAPSQPAPSPRPY